MSIPKSGPRCSIKRLLQKCQECLPDVRRKCNFCIASNKGVRGDFHAVSEGYCALMKELHQELLEREKQICEQKPTAKTVKAGATVAAESGASSER